MPRVSPSGGSLASGFIGYRFNQAFGLLLYRVNNLKGDEESRVTGLVYATINIIGVPITGDVIAFSISQSGMTTQNFTYTVTATDNPVSITQGLSNLINNNTTMTSAGFYSVSPMGVGPFAQYSPQLANMNLTNSGLILPQPGCQITNIKTFSVSQPVVTHQAGSTMSVGVPVNGLALSPTSTVDPTTNPVTVLSGYIPILNYLEGASIGSTQNLDTKRADVWYARPTEAKQRVQLYNWFQWKFATFLGVPMNSSANPGIMAYGAGSNAYEVV